MNVGNTQTQTSATDAETDFADYQDPKLAVTELLDQAVATAQEAGLTTSDLLGILHYYAHCVAASYRDSVIQENSGSGSQANDELGENPLV